jgi:hypothetical protein
MSTIDQRTRARVEGNDDMTSVAVVDVIKLDLDAKQLQRYNIEAPAPKSQMDGEAFSPVGWVIGRSNPAVAVEVLHKDSVIQRVAIDVDRPDVAAAFPEVPGLSRVASALK